MSNEVRGVYGDLEQVANRFASAQADVVETLQRVRAAMDPLENGSWIGRGFDSFSREMRGEVLPAVRDNAEIKAAYPKLALTDNPWGRAAMGCSSGGAAASLKPSPSPRPYFRKRSKKA